MIYLRIWGRCGNQLFQYAFARYVSEINNNEPITIDFSVCDQLADKQKDPTWKNQLKDFSIKDVALFSKKGGNIFKYKMSPVQQIVYFLYKKCVTKQNSCLKKQKQQRRWMPLMEALNIYCYTDGYYPYRNLIKKGDKFLIGFFESVTYIDKIREILIDEYKPIYPPKKENAKLYKTIQDTESVCISIRRGDFFKTKGFAICGEKYFTNAINEIERRVKNPTYIVFSDDIEWVKQNMSFPGKVYYETGKDPIYEKIRLMSGCKHFIISNSTFSWWSQYLATNPEKVVVAPDHWNNLDMELDIMQKEWILVKTN